MLTRLKISSFALVDDIELTFERGMSVLTGETGAGKSIIVTALGLALGDRADRDQIRHGCDRALVEATFSVERMSRQYKTEFLDYIEDGQFIVTREISRDGSSKVRINGTMATVTRLRELASPLSEVLGQHSSRLLLDEENHLLFLDRFAGVDDIRKATGQLFTTWEKTRSELKRTCKQRDELERERELLLFQQREIEQAEVKAGEEDQLNQERRILDASRTLIESAASITSLLGGDDRSVADSLRLASRELEKMVAIDATLESQAKQLSEIDFLLEELRGMIEKYGGAVPDDPHRQEAINERLDEIYNLKQKYGGSEEAIITTLEQINVRLADRPDVSALISKLEASETAARNEYSTKAVQLSEVRKKAARYLNKLAIREMAELAITDGQFDSEFLYEERADGVEIRGQIVRPFAHGLESCRFLFSANLGEPLKSLIKTASGGEISRVLLALKSAERKSNKLAYALLVFDEVDAGIGGQTAIAVGAKLKKLAETNQVIVITHLHQIARLADHHYRAEKSSGQGKRVTISVTRLTESDVSAEIDRMVALPHD